MDVGLFPMPCDRPERPPAQSMRPLVEEVAPNVPVPAAGAVAT